MAVAGEMDAAITAVLSELDGMFRLKEQKYHCRLFLVDHIVLLYL